MEILLHDKSFQISSQIERNIKCIDDTISVKKVYGPETAISNASAANYKILITDGNNLEGRFKELTHTFKGSNPDSYLIVLLCFGDIKLKDRFIDNGADSCFDRISEFDLFIDFIKSINKEFNDNLNFQNAV